MARLSVVTLGSEVAGAVNNRFSVGMGVMEFCIEHLKKSSDSGIGLNLVRLLEAMCANNPDNVRKLAAMDGFGTLAKCARDARLYYDHKLVDHSMKLMAMVTKEPSKLAGVFLLGAQ
eukprot:675540_1